MNSQVEVVKLLATARVLPMFYHPHLPPLLTSPHLHILLPPLSFSAVRQQAH